MSSNEGGRHEGVFTRMEEMRDTYEILVGKLKGTNHEED
jgi:hypothetical protein